MGEDDNAPLERRKVGKLIFCRPKVNRDMKIHEVIKLPRSEYFFFTTERPLKCASKKCAKTNLTRRK